MKTIFSKVFIISGRDIKEAKVALISDGEVVVREQWRPLKKPYTALLTCYVLVAYSQSCKRSR